MYTKAVIPYKLSSSANLPPSISNRRSSMYIAEVQPCTQKAVLTTQKIRNTHK